MTKRKRYTSANFYPVGDVDLCNVEYDLIADLQIMSRESFWKNELHNEDHPDFLRKYSTEVPEYMILYIVERLEEYWKILYPERYEEQ